MSTEVCFVLLLMLISTEVCFRLMLTMKSMMLFVVSFRLLSFKCLSHPLYLSFFSSLLLSLPDFYFSLFPLPFSIFYIPFTYSLTMRCILFSQTFPFHLCLVSQFRFWSVCNRTAFYQWFGYWLLFESRFHGHWQMSEEDWVSHSVTAKTNHFLSLQYCRC